jgi:hypothetical protein
MILRRLQLTAVAVVLSACFIAAGATRPAVTAAAAPAPAQANWVFEGCWTYWPSGPCRDVFRDSQGNYWLCRACGTTGTPNSTKCSRISPQTLGIGYWCS